MEARRIVIVGGGFSGAMVAAHLLRDARAPLDVTLVEKRPWIARGAAYSTTDPCHLLNVPAARMSALAKEPDHFRAWLQAHKADIGVDVPSDGFAPRKIYALYLRDVLEEARKTAVDGVRWRALRDEAVAVEPGSAREQGAVRIVLKSGTILPADKVVLAFGNLAPLDPKVGDGSFYRASARYVRDPWSPEAMGGLPAGASVLLIGTGLTMADLAVTLEKSGHQGTVHAVSRHGLMPLEHKPYAPYPNFIDPNAPRTLRGLFQEVRKRARAAAGSGSDWRAVIDSLRPHSHAIWKGLDLAERRRFLRHVRHYWDVHRHRVAPEIGAALARMRESGFLRVHAGRIQEFREDARGVDVAIRLRKDGRLRVLRVDRVINCTGPDSNYGASGDPLIRSLISRGLLRPHPLSMGLAAAADGGLIGEDGSASRIFYALGTPRIGELWETIAVPELRAQAQDLAQILLA